MAKVVRNPIAGLEKRPNDIHLSAKQYLPLSLFSGLGKPPSLERWPGALVVRRYAAGEPLFIQGEAGWTAFYILTIDDAIAIQTMRLETLRDHDEKVAAQAELNRLRVEAHRRKQNPNDETARHAATVQVANLAKDYSPQRRLRKMLEFASRPSGPSVNREGGKFYQPVGGPATISYNTNEVPLAEGDLFGELSCLYRTPRSATVVAKYDCYMIEFLRHVLDGIHNDKVYKARADGIYLKRFFELQVRKMPLFTDLSKEEMEAVRNGIELVSYEPGQIICDEHERSDCMYIVRQGLVKVATNVSHMLGKYDVTDWSAFANCLSKGATLPATTPIGKFWSLLSERAKEILRAPELDKLSPAERNEFIFAVNDLLKERKLIDAAEFAPLTGREGFLHALPKKRPDKKKDWGDGLVRQHNRLLLEALCPAGVRPYQRHQGVETILTYCSTNDYFGEIGLMMNAPRSATCIAFGHPDPEDKGKMEGELHLVKIPGATFDKLIKMSPTLKTRVREEIDRRRRKTIEEKARPVWESGQVQFSEQFAKLGLIQGQRLMLIDLDRCTRCDECVKACVGNHSDGNSRLFLDGPRFGKFLVPITCRSCLDPVCMIPCPVSSIRRGDDKQIVIEDWCIGCEGCAKACPYGSIQMQDLGLIPDAARGWHWLPATAKEAQGDWTKPGYKDAAWRSEDAPVVWERDFQDKLRALGALGALNDPVTKSVRFRREFQVTPALLGPDGHFKVEMVTQGSNAHVWINGVELTVDRKPRSTGQHEYTIPPATKDAKPLTEYLRVGANVIAVEVTPTCPASGIVMQLRLDPIKKPTELPQDVEEYVRDEVSEKQVTLKAVVCDMCASAKGNLPACVHACPHDAAMRVDARVDFPTK